MEIAFYENRNYTICHIFEQSEIQYQKHFQNNLYNEIHISDIK